MPWTAKQLKLFRAAAHNPAIAKSSGIKQADAERMLKEGLKKAAGGLAKINKQDTRHGKIDMPFNKVSRFAGMNVGGSVESKAMVKKEVGFMKKKGAPASMIKHEMAEMKGMKKGGMMRPKKDIEADQMAMAPYKKGGLKMAKGGSIKEVMGPRGMGSDVEKGSNVKRAHGEHGIQKRGHTRALEEKMVGGPKKFAGGGMMNFKAGGSIRAHGEHSIQTKGHTRGKVC